MAYMHSVLVMVVHREKEKWEYIQVATQYPWWETDVMGKYRVQAALWEVRGISSKMQSTTEHSPTNREIETCDVVEMSGNRKCPEIS
jgi:hypothetical protein